MARLRFLFEGGEREVELRRDGRDFLARLGGREVRGKVLWEAGEEVAFEVGGRVVRARVERQGEERRVRVGEKTYRLRVGSTELAEVGGREEGARGGSRAGLLTSPLPGKVVEVRVREEQVVEAGSVLLVVEAMKMEHPFRAEGRGRVVRLHVREGDEVAPGAPLVEIAPAEEIRETAED